MSNRIKCLEEVIRTVQREDFPAQDESNVKRAVIERVISSLGWSIHDFDEVVSEHSTRFDNQTGRADYALCLDGAPKVFIEAKRPGCANDHAAEQTFRYAYQAGGNPLLVLTDGRIWKFYNPAAQGPSRNDRCACELDIGDDHEEQVEAVLLEMLSRDAVASGRARQCMTTALKMKRLDREYEAKREGIKREYEAKFGSSGMTFHRPAPPVKAQDVSEPRVTVAGAAQAEGRMRGKGQRVKGSLTLTGADGQTIKVLPFKGGAGGWIDLVDWLAQSQGDAFMSKLQKALGSRRIADQKILRKIDGRPYGQQAPVAGKWVFKSLTWKAAESLMRKAAAVAGYGISIQIEE